VHFIRDPRTGVQNFEGKLERVPTPKEFAFHRCPTYVTPSQDAVCTVVTGRGEAAHSPGPGFIGREGGLQLHWIDFVLDQSTEPDLLRPQRYVQWQSQTSRSLTDDQAAKGSTCPL
jgi:hypothetical protein